MTIVILMKQRNEEMKLSSLGGDDDEDAFQYHKLNSSS